MHRLKKTAVLLSLVAAIGAVGTSAYAQTVANSDEGQRTAAECYTREISERTRENAELNRDTAYYIDQIMLKHSDGKRLSAEYYAQEIAARNKENAEHNRDTAYYVEQVKRNNNMP